MSTPKLKTETYKQMGGINTKASAYITGNEEFLDLSNVDFTTPGALTKREGSTLSFGATVTGRISGLYEFQRLSGASAIIATANTNAYNLSTGSFSSFKSGLLNGGLFDFVTFVDRLFMCNGQDFFKYDLTNNYPYSLPPGLTITLGQTGTGGMTGIFIYQYGYLNERGFYGAVGPGVTIGVSSGFAVVITGFTTPANYGITAISVYRTVPNQTVPFRVQDIVAGSSLLYDPNFTNGTVPSPEYLWFTMAPRYMEIYNNQLFMAGFSSQLSTVWFSDIGEPEGVLPEYNIEVRTNDGDRVTALKTYSDNLLIFKENSFHRLRGANPDDFNLSEVSAEYGALSNRAVVNWEDVCWFLDKKGIVEFNGANVKIVSNEIEPILLTMNVAAAKENAVAQHVRLRNELWFSIPCNGSTMNNCTLVYDYLSQAWTKFEGFEPSSLRVIQATQDKARVYFGGYSGSISNFGASLMGDNGSGITALIKTRYIAPGGQTTEQQFRRFYLNCDTVSGSTGGITISLRANYGSSISVTRAMSQNPFQSRIDFGIPARSLSAEINHYNASLPLRVYGFTFETREQRRV